MPGPENLFSKCGTEKYKCSHRRFTSHPGQLTICVGRHSYLMYFWPLPHQVMKFSCSHSVPSFCLLSSLTGNVWVSPPAPPFFTFHQIHLNQELFQPQWMEPKQQTLTTTMRSSLRHGLASVFCYFPGEHLAPSSKYKTKVDPSPRYPKTSSQMTSRKISSAELRSEESPCFSNFEPLICAGRQ